MKAICTSIIVAAMTAAPVLGQDESARIDSALKAAEARGHADLGALSVIRKTALDQGPVQVIVKAEREPEAMLTVDIDPASNKIRRFGIQVGG